MKPFELILLFSSHLALVMQEVISPRIIQKQTKLPKINENFITVSLSVGSRSLNMQVDTFSDFSWIQAESCVNCPFTSQKISRNRPEFLERRLFRSRVLEGELIKARLSAFGFEAETELFVVFGVDEPFDFKFDGIIGAAFNKGISPILTIRSKEEKPQESFVIRLSQRNPASVIFSEQLKKDNRWFEAKPNKKGWILDFQTARFSSSIMPMSNVSLRFDSTEKGLVFPRRFTGWVTNALLHRGIVCKFNFTEQRVQKDEPKAMKCLQKGLMSPGLPLFRLFDEVKMLEIPMSLFKQNEKIGLISSRFDLTISFEDVEDIVAGLPFFRAFEIDLDWTNNRLGFAGARVRKQQVAQPIGKNALRVVALLLMGVALGQLVLIGIRQFVLGRRFEDVFSL